MLIVQCPKCEKPSKAFPNEKGLKGKCPHCGIVIPIKPVKSATTEDLAEIKAEPGLTRQIAPVLPDTSPPTLPLAAPAAVGTWLIFRFGQGWLKGTFAEPAWPVLESCLWVGQAEVFMFLWGVILIAWKAGLLVLQKRHLKRNPFPDRFAPEAKLGPDQVEDCLAHLGAVARRPRRSILLNRICLALEHLRQTKSVQEVRGALTGQSAIDANILDSSYTVMRFLIWVIPILGFIGTVVGIGIAVNQFADCIPKDTDLEKGLDSLRAGLGQVTSGLATAFNTTLVGLVLVAPLMFLTSWLRKEEEHLLAQIDHFSNHDLLGRLAEESDTA